MARLLRWSALAGCLTGAAALAPASSLAAAAPPSGRYEATLCVANAGQPPSCGPADVVVRPGGSVRVQVSDIVYQLLIRSGQAAIVVMHGAMQIDEFEAEARWDGTALRFADAEKHLRYEVQVGAPKGSAR